MLAARTVLAILFGVFFSVTAAFSGEVRLSVAASMSDAVKQMIAGYEQKHPDVKILPNFGASGALAKQVEQGAPADVFISASTDWMDYLVGKKYVVPQEVSILAYNALVVVGDKKLKISSMNDLTKLRLIAIGSPQSVPAGKYAEQAMKAAGIYSNLASRLVMAQDVRQALLYADRGEADAAFVYKTDALLAKSAGILFEVPADLYDQVTYPVGATVQSAAKPEVKAFMKYLRGAEAGKILDQYGFVVR